MVEHLRWAMWPWHRCRAYKEHSGTPQEYWGRCDLKKLHGGDHALERGLIIIRWSTEITTINDPSYYRRR